MKLGDTVEVTMAGQVVAHAKIMELDAETATLIIPGTRVVMAVSTQLTTAPDSEQSKQVIIEGADRVDADGNVVETPEPVETVVQAVEPVEPAPVEEKVESDENGN